MGQIRVDDEGGRSEPSTVKVGLGCMKEEHRQDTGTGLSIGSVTPHSPEPHALDLRFPSPAPLAGAQGCRLLH